MGKDPYRVKTLGPAWLGGFLTSLFAFLIFLIPGVEFLSQILGGTITNLDQFIIGLGGSGFSGISVIGYLGVTAVEMMLFRTFPFSWVISYRIDDAITILLMIIPWILSGFVIGKTRVQDPKHGLRVGIVLIIWGCLWWFILLILVPLLMSNIPFIGPMITGAINALSKGFTDMPMGVSAMLTQLQGGAFFTGILVLMGIQNESKSEGSL
ncbi:MAG: hypothetical protein ACTSUE_02995 [Promethearchaeota archaeon]